MAENQDKLVPFDANQAMQAIKDKIKSAFVELIPDEQWSEMVKKEVDDFFQEKNQSNHSYGGSNSNNYRSSFQLIVNEELNKATREKVDLYLKENYSTVWDTVNGGQKADAKISEIISKNAGNILVDILAVQISHRLQQFNR